MTALVLFSLPLRCLPLWWLTWAWRRQELNLHSWGWQLNIPSKGHGGNPFPQFQFQALCQGRVYPKEETSLSPVGPEPPPQWGWQLNIPSKGHEGNPSPQFQVLCQGKYIQNVKTSLSPVGQNLGPGTSRSALLHFNHLGTIYWSATPAYKASVDTRMNLTSYHHYKLQANMFVANCWMSKNCT